MTVRLGVDFGTCNTRLARGDAAGVEARTISVPGLTATLRVPGGDADVAAAVPSVIHYLASSVVVGEEVRARRLEGAPETFRWMKRYVSQRLDLPRTVHGKRVGFMQAARDFLGEVLRRAVSPSELAEAEVALTVPVEASEHYPDWLTRAAEAAGLRRVRLLDEATAAALGYGLAVRADEVYMVFDFGGGTMNAAVVRFEETADGVRGHVLGKGGAEVGGTVIDQWLLQDLLARAHRRVEDLREGAGPLLVEIERVKQALTATEAVDVTVKSGTPAVRYTRTQLEDLLEARGLFNVLQRVLDQALAGAHERGWDREQVRTVLMVGGSCLVPAVRRAVRQVFGDRARYHRPLDAVALGAAAFAGGATLDDHVQHDYALREFDPSLGDYVYRLLVPAGSPYPSPREVCRLTLKAAVDGAPSLGLDVYEIGYAQTATAAAVELAWDESGRPRLLDREAPDPQGNFWRFTRPARTGEQTFLSETAPPSDVAARRVHVTSLFWVNEACPTFVSADPPARRGERRFPVAFTVDDKKRLSVTVKDNQTSRTLLQSHPMVTLR